MGGATTTGSGDGETGLKVTVSGNGNFNATKGFIVKNTTTDKSVITIINKATDFKGLVKTEDTDTKAAINVTNGDGAAAAKISGDITGGVGALTITNNAQSELAGSITGGKGKLIITNKGSITKSAAQKIAFGEGGGELTNKGTIAQDIEGGTGTAEGQVTTIINSNTITGAITGKAGILQVSNEKGASITGGITAGAGAITINNAGTIKGENKTISLGDAGSVVTIINGKDGQDETAVNHDAEIGDKIVSNAKGAKLNLTNYGKITGAIDMVNTNKQGTAIITNEQGATISGDITMAFGANKGENTLTNKGEITGNITAGQAVGEVATDSHTVIINSGTIAKEDGKGTLSLIGKGSVLTNEKGATIGHAITLNGENSELTNKGDITNKIEVTGKGLKLNNEGGKIIHADGIKIIGAGTDASALTNSGVISKIETATGGTLTLTNTGAIDQIVAEKNTTINVSKGYTVDISSNRTNADGSKWDYDTDGAIKVTGNSSSEGGKVNFGTGASTFAATSASSADFVVSNLDVGKAYDLDNFVKASGSTTNFADKNLQQKFDSLYFAGGNASKVEFDPATGTIVRSVDADKSIGALGAIQSIANMNSQMTRAQSIIDGVFDAVAAGEIGHLPYPREGYLSTPYTGASKKSKLEEKIAELEETKDPKAKEEKLAEILAESAKSNKSWIGFATPYFSTSSINVKGFAATSGSAMGFVGGAAKAFDNGVLFGAHIGVESQNAGKVGAEMQSLGSSFMAGVHTKMPLGQVNKASLSLVPFVKLQANAMLAANSYRLSPMLSNDYTREATGLVKGFSASALFGLDMPTNFGYITPEIGLMQQAVIMPELAFNGYKMAANNQTMNGTTATPLYLLAQVRYTKAIKLEKMSLFPTIKAGIRYAMMGDSFVSAIRFTSSSSESFYATNTIDSFVGVVEAGLGAKIGENTGINLSYGGEFGSQISTHNINVRVGWQF